jgi:hypothetical protein
VEADGVTPPQYLHTFPRWCLRKLRQSAIIPLNVRQRGSERTHVITDKIIKARRGPKKAIMAVAASIPCRHLSHAQGGTMYKDLGCDHFIRRSTDQQKKRLVKRSVDLVYAVEIKPLVA